MKDRTMRLPVRLLNHLADALREAPRPGVFPRRLWQTILTGGWAYCSDVDDLMLAMDRRLVDLDLRQLAEAADYPTRYMRDRPRFATADWMASPMMAAADVAGFCIFLEQLGFTVDPKPMVDSLYDQVAALPRMTIAQADIYCYAALHQKHRLTLLTQESVDGTPDQQDWRSPGGYRYQCLTRGGQAAVLTITSPKWRPPRRSEVDCPQCGARYTRGDPESALHHRSVHAQAMRVLMPRPSKRMREQLEHRGERVDGNAPLWTHREVASRALHFKREFGYDFVQWPDVITRAKLDQRWVGFLFADADGAIDGACAFYNDAGAEWALQWVWIRPDRRRHGLLAARWPGFLAEFGDFWIEHPLSEAMQGFVARHASAGQLELIAKRYPHGSPIEQPITRRGQAFSPAEVR
jgi:hypothetical protein